MREAERQRSAWSTWLMFRPFPGDLLGPVLKGRKKGVVFWSAPTSRWPPTCHLMREIRAVLSKSLENGRSGNGADPTPNSATYNSLKDMPAAVFRLLRPRQPRPAAGRRRRAVENMLPDGKQKRLFYLSIDFVRQSMMTPKQEIYQQSVSWRPIPTWRIWLLRGSENPNLMPKDSITVRMHSVGGWGAITTGKNLAMTLFDLLGYHVKANPKYGSEKKGQPTSYYLSAAPEPIRINCEYFYVDVVLSRTRTCSATPMRWPDLNRTAAFW